MNLKKEMLAVHERLDAIEAAISGLQPKGTKTTKKATTKKKPKKIKDLAKSRVPTPTSVKTTSDDIAKVEM
jgi:hypothetical protein